MHDAQATGEAFRFQNPRLAVTPHVFSSLNAALTRQAVDEIIEDIITGLTHPVSEPAHVASRMTTYGPRDDVITFTDRDYRACFERMNEAFLEWGWSDGFPLIPPTDEAVTKMLGGTTQAPDAIVVEQFVPGMAQATVRNIAINAVMAGCKPEFLPVVITAVEAMLDLIDMASGKEDFFLNRKVIGSSI